MQKKEGKILEEGVVVEKSTAAISMAAIHRKASDLSGHLLMEVNG